jgi:hypothetical protein
MSDHVLNCWTMSRRDHILNRVGDKGTVNRISFAGQFEATKDNVVSLARGRNPSNERFDHEIEKQGR